MSGGSFYYLYSKTAAEVLSGGSSMDELLEKMRYGLLECGHQDAAERVGQLITVCQHARDTVGHDMRELEEIMKAVEWWQNGDWGRDRVAEAVEKWRKSVSEASTVPGGNDIEVKGPVKLGEVGYADSPASEGDLRVS